MIKREECMSRFRLFIRSELIKVLTGILSSGKSVMLDLIHEELLLSSVSKEQFIFINFEDISNAHLTTATALYEEILKRTASISGKAYPFFDEIQ